MEYYSKALKSNKNVLTAIRFANALMFSVTHPSGKWWYTYARTQFCIRCACNATIPGYEVLPMRSVSWKGAYIKFLYVWLEFFYYVCLVLSH